jgi:hypothetical protein
VGDVGAVLAAAADGCRPAGAVPEAALAGRLPSRLDVEYCTAIADHYDRAPDASADPGLRRRYEVLARDAREQYDAAVQAGISVEPWTGPGQPYRGSAELIGHVLSSGTIRLYPTRTGFGPRDARADHPLQQPAGVRAGGLDLCHNDLLRVVHDLFGHVLHRAPFGPRGEFLATYGHMQFCRPEGSPALFVEHVAQICWFYFGPHLRDRHGRLPRRGEPGYLPPQRRPYPEQKVVAFPDDLLARFTACWEEALT